MVNLRPIRIMLVEDDPGDQKLIKSSLKGQRIINEIDVADTGEDALSKIETLFALNRLQELPDLILLDLNMPGMGGKHFLKMFKSDDRFKHIPVVILTTSDSEKDILESYQLHAAGYVKKPIRFEEFQTVLQGIEKYWFTICTTPQL